MTERRIEVADVPADAISTPEKWQHIRQVARVTRTVETKKGTTVETVLLITNASTQKLSPAQLLHINRKHWAIESQHWIRDVVLREDNATTRLKNTPENVATCNQTAITFLKQHFGKVTEGIQIARKNLSPTIDAIVVFSK